MLFVHESLVPAPAAKVFAFHERADALELLTPPWEPVRIVRAASSLRPGERALIRVRVGPFWVDWEAEHTRYEKDVLFEDAQVRGPFRSWVHTHKFNAADGGTLLRDEVRIELPLGVLGLPAWPLVRRKLRRLFRYRHEVTRAGCVGAT